MFMREKRTNRSLRQKTRWTLKRKLKKKSKKIKKYIKKKSKKIKKFLKKQNGRGSRLGHSREPEVDEETIAELKKDEISINVYIIDLGQKCIIKIDKDVTTPFWKLVEVEINNCSLLASYLQRGKKIYSISFGGEIIYSITEDNNNITAEDLGIEDGAVINVELNKMTSDLKFKQASRTSVGPDNIVSTEDKNAIESSNPIFKNIIHKKYGSISSFLEDVKKMVYSVISPHFAGEEFLHPYIVYVAKGNTVLLEGRTVIYKSDITPERISLPEGSIDIPEGTIKVLWRPGEEINERVCYDGVRSIDVSWWDNGDDYDYAQKRIRDYSRDIIEYL